MWFFILFPANFECAAKDSAAVGLTSMLTDAKRQLAGGRHRFYHPTLVGTKVVGE